MRTLHFGRVSVVIMAMVLAATMLAACGSDSSSSGTSASQQTSGSTESESTGGNENSALAAITKEVEEAAIPPTTLPIEEIGLKPYTPKPGAKFVNISCDVSIVGCNTVSNEIGEATEALGYGYTRCDAGSSPEGANRCFTNAVNAKPDAIITNAVGANIAGAGFEAAQKAGIPVIGWSSGEDKGVDGTDVQVGYEQCQDEARLQAKAIAAETEGDANVLYVGETSIACVAVRIEAFKEEFPKVCPGCHVEYLEFNLATMQTALPQQIQAAINQNPELNWIVGGFDGVAAIANTAVQQAGKEGQISVAGVDGDPANIEVMEQGGPQKIDISGGWGIGTWTSADAAARIFSGQKVPAGIPSSILLLTPENIGEVLDSEKSWRGPEGFEEKFEKLWNK